MHNGFLSGSAHPRRRNFAISAIYFLTFGAFCFPTLVHAQIFIASNHNASATIGEFSNGSSNPQLITDLSAVEGITVAGSDLFITAGNSVDEYTTTGTPVATPLVSNLPDDPYDVAVSGSNLFLTFPSLGTIAEYSMTDSSLNPAFAHAG